MWIRAWRHGWMWLAIAACGGGDAPAWMRTTPTPGAPGVSIHDAPPLAGATYVATVEDGGFGEPGPQVVFEHGRFQCGHLVRLLGRGADLESASAAAARATCDPAVAELLRQGGGFVLVVDGAGPRWLTADDVLAAAAPIDTPAKALLAVWITGRYDLSWSDGGRIYGGPDHGIVREVAGGFEVVGGTRRSDLRCNSEEHRELVSLERVTLFVDAAGRLDERERVVSHRYEVADPCHPLGRRPADFVDVASGGTVRGHLLRALHHEAESVRAFERIARELRALGAPDELWQAALAAADDERDHAARCARLAGAPVAIAADELPLRGRLELALDNAREGCIGEAYAALVNVVQATTAADPALRAHFAAIAADELAHAALASAIAAWLDAGLSPDERAAVRAARADAARTLAASLDAPPTPATRALGLPHGAEALRLLAAVVAAAGWGGPPSRQACPVGPARADFRRTSIP